MGKARLEAFTDGVIAIIITIMVLEMKVPSGTDLAALAASAPVFSAYVLSYVNVGIFWLNHHHMMHATVHIDGRVLWANLALLFWLSLVPLDPLDRRGRFFAAADGRLWRRAGDGGRLIQADAGRDHCPQWPRLRPRERRRERRQGHAVARALCRVRAARILRSEDFDCALRRCRRDVVRAGPED
jgi:hypothetical protein